jgi:Ca2+-binding RTX toxin-like protein
MTIAGTVAVRGVSGVEVYELANGGANRVTLANLNFAGVTGGTITVYGGNAGNTVNASALTGADRVVVWGGAGKDVLTGGAGNDIFKFTAATLTASDMVKGGAGNNEIDITTAGTVAAGGVGGVETWALANGGADSLTLANINFTGFALHTITVYGGNSGNTISEAGVAAADQVLMRGGAGAGQNAAMTGGAGKDVFWFTTPGSTKTPDTNTITDFTHASDRIAFSDGGFALGLKGASAAPKPLPATLFTANPTGSFGTAAERFAYDTATGALYYDARGNAVGSSRELVATLGSHPTVTGADLFYVS